MSYNSIDWSSVKSDLGKSPITGYYYVGKFGDVIPLSPLQSEEYEDWLKNGGKSKEVKGARGKKTSPLSTIKKKYAKFFDKDFNWKAKWIKPLNVTGGTRGANGEIVGQNFNYERKAWKDHIVKKTGLLAPSYDSSYQYKGTGNHGGTIRKWGTDINRHASYKSYFKGAKTQAQIINARNTVNSSFASRGAVLEGFKEFQRHIEIARYQMQLMGENWRILVGQRALKVFKESFKYQKFYSGGTNKWQPLARFTQKKREKRGTYSKPTPILREYGDLEKSLKFEDHGAWTSIVTQPVEANEAHYKKHTICYAGYHNNPNPWDTYGRWGRGGHPKKYVQRQFMGHSDKLNPLTDSFMKKMMKLYLFDSVFLVKQV